MNYDEFKERRVEKANYGAAPAELVTEYQTLIEKMERLYAEGIPLTSEPMLVLNSRVDELYHAIDKYIHPPEESPR